MGKILIYVSGPYRDDRGTAYVEKNIRAAEEVAQELWRMGFAVICPHANTRHFDGIVSSEEFIAGDLEMIARCDAVVFGKGFITSAGCLKEFNHAKNNGIPVYFWSVERDHLLRLARSV